MSVDALSLACNIITVIDFGHSFYETFRNIYDKGASDPNIGDKTNELALLSKNLKESRDNALQSSTDNDQLFKVADKCITAAENLQKEIGKLTPSGSPSRTTRISRSLFSAVKRTWRHNRIQQLNNLLDNCQAIMETTILLHMYESGEAEQVRRLEDFEKLETRLQVFVDAVSKHDLQISQLLAENRLLHQKLRRDVVAWQNAQVSDAELARFKSSLRFSGINQRYNEINTGHKKSFKWLLGDPKATSVSDFAASDISDSDAPDTSDSDAPDISDSDASDTSDSGSSDHGNIGLKEELSDHRESRNRTSSDSEETDTSDSEPSDQVDADLEGEPDYIRDLRNGTFGDFKEWLTLDNDSKLYWISGKPGAGKSTLMKHLFRRMENEDLIEGPHLIIRHFFWLGVSDTRSRLNDMEGMYMALLYQLLDQEVCGKSVASLLLRDNPRIKQKESPTDWDFEELSTTTKEALNVVARQCAVYVLIDALDEHLPAGKHDELLAAIGEFEKLANVRLVLSSRREVIFDDRFTRSRQLQLQTLTGPDIYHFALDSLLKAAKYSQGGCSRYLIKELAEEVVEKAEGVFLWAHLAVGSLKRGFVDRNRKDELWGRLNNMPSDLSDYFKSIWMRLGDDQKIYRVFAANVFSLLTCKAKELSPFREDHPLSFLDPPWEPDLLITSLALNPGTAYSLIQEESHVEETYLLQLCQDSERDILSHCAGLVELIPFDDCVDCGHRKDGLISPTKICRFVHRTAREFFHGTPEGKDLIKCNDMARDGPSFRLMLGYLARSVAFRDARHALHQCSLILGFKMYQVLEEISDLGSSSDISTECQHSLVTLCHKLHFRFSGHPDNPIFELWDIIDHSYPLYPFLAIAADCGYGDWAVDCLEKQASSECPLPAEIYAMVFRATLQTWLRDLDDDWHDSDWFDQKLKSFNKMILRFQAFRLPSKVYHDKSAMSGSNRRYHEMLSIADLVLATLLHIISMEEDVWNRSTNAIETLVDVVLDLVGLLGNSDDRIFETIICASGLMRNSATRDWKFFIPVFTPNSPSILFGTPGVQIVFETSRMRLIQYAARAAASIPGLERLCSGLSDFVELYCHVNREDEKPRPILLSKSQHIPSPTQFCAVDIEAEYLKVIPFGKRDELRRMLENCFNEIDTGHCSALQRTVERIWAETQGKHWGWPKMAELLISHGVWCSKEEQERILTACHVRMGPKGDVRLSHESSLSRTSWVDRLLKPPDGCSEEDEMLSYLLMPMNPWT